jgi:predicted YcjX-like family ATPase
LAKLTTLTDDARIALDTFAGRTTNLFSPSLRLGVTGLSRAGKTVFITSLVHNIVHGGRLPMFEARKTAENRPRLSGTPARRRRAALPVRGSCRRWLTQPRSGRIRRAHISEMRLTIEYESASGWNRLFSAGKLSLDIVDYPGEWLTRPAAAWQIIPNSRTDVRAAAPAARAGRIWPSMMAGTNGERQAGRDADEMTAAKAGGSLHRLPAGLQDRRARAFDVAARAAF